MEKRITIIGYKNWNEWDQSFRLKKNYYKKQFFLSYINKNNNLAAPYKYSLFFDINNKVF